MVFNVFIEMELPATHASTRPYQQPNKAPPLYVYSLTVPRLLLDLSFSGALTFTIASLWCFAGITDIVGAVLLFSEADGTDSEGVSSSDEVTINHLIVGHSLEF